MPGSNGQKKIIALLPFRNEEWILSEYIESIKKITDHIIAYDDRSTDNSRKMLEDAGANVITRDYKSDSYFAEYQVRQELLEEGRRQGGTHFVCLDADEIFTDAFLRTAKESILALKPGHSIWMDWVNLYKKIDKERIDGDYKKLSKAFIFCDEPSLKFKYVFVGVSRTPTEIQNRIVLGREQGAVIHFQFLNIDRALTKRTWYMCSEAIKAERSAERINVTYSVQKDLNIPTRTVDSNMFAKIEPAVYTEYDRSTDWRYQEVLEWFKKYGMLKFESLDIWEDPTLLALFKSEVGRDPKPRIIPLWVLKLNNVKNKIINTSNLYKNKLSGEKLFRSLHASIPLSVRKKVGPILAYISYISRLIYNPIRINILSLEATIDHITKHELSAIRFGDGEMSLINKDTISFQENNDVLTRGLVKILQTKNEKLLICIPNIFGRLDNFTSRSFWFTIHHVFKYGRFWKKLTSENQTYGDAFITRPFLSYKNKDHAGTIFKKLFQIWKGKNVVLIEGSLSRLGVGNDMFNEVGDMKRILCPAENAFSKYEEIKAQALTIPKDRLILLSLGPTAKILAYDLFMLGYRVLDIGHIDMEYEMFLRKSENLVKVKYKYFNELNERNPEECNDQKYISEIIATIN